MVALFLTLSNRHKVHTFITAAGKLPSHLPPKTTKATATTTKIIIIKNKPGLGLLSPCKPASKSKAKEGKIGISEFFSVLMLAPDNSTERTVSSFGKGVKEHDYLLVI